MAALWLDTGYIPTAWGAPRILESPAVLGAALGVDQAFEQLQLPVYQALLLCRGLEGLLSRENSESLHMRALFRVRSPTRVHSKVSSRSQGCILRWRQGVTVNWLLVSHCFRSHRYLSMAENSTAVQFHCWFNFHRFNALKSPPLALMMMWLQHSPSVSAAVHTSPWKHFSNWLGTSNNKSRVYFIHSFLCPFFF